MRLEWGLQCWRQRANARYFYGEFLEAGDWYRNVSCDGEESLSLSVALGELIGVFADCAGVGAVVLLLCNNQEMEMRRAHLQA